MKVTINADDFGISPGVNGAIEQAFLQGKLNSTSLICGCGYFDEAVAIAKKNPDLQIGLHFNLTTGKSTAGVASTLTDQNNIFKNGFLKILLRTLFQRRKFLDQVENELNSQINLLKQNGLNPQHIDGHRHIHFIPGIFKIVCESARENNIPNIRVINENIFSTWKINHQKSFLWNGGIVKWLVLRTCGLLNGSKKINHRYFFSILYSCKISKELIDKIEVPKKFTELEIMIHPGNPDIDSQFKNLEEKSHLLSKERYSEQL